jgi:hypothetical protein
MGALGAYFSCLDNGLLINCLKVGLLLANTNWLLLSFVAWNIE